MPVFSSAKAVTSGTVRQTCPAGAGHGVLDDRASAEAAIHTGWAHSLEMPPPPPPAYLPSFQTRSWGGWVTLIAVVPPTPTTYGCDAGAASVSTGDVGNQLWYAHASFPPSPEVLNTVWPWAAACSKIEFSAA